ncbi:MAG: response regulator transcription factor [Anaerolineae bacterium]
MHVLVLGGKDNARRIIIWHLEREGFQVSDGPLGDDAPCQIADVMPDLVLLVDTGEHAVLTRMCQLIREPLLVPIIVLLGSDPGTLVVRALRAGADDVITPSFSLAELSARIMAVLRRTLGDAQGGGARYVDERLSIDLAERRVTVDGERAKVSPSEFRLLTCLVQHRGTIVSHQQAIDAVWGEGDPDSHGKRLSLYVGYLRHKIEFDPRHPRYIRTVYGEGYWFGSPHDPEP